LDPTVYYPEGWTAPTELMGPLPRRTRMSLRGAAVAAASVGALAFAVAVAVQYNFDRARLAARTAVWRRESIETTGRVTRVWSRCKLCTPMASYAFTVDGVAYTGQCPVPASRRAGLRQDGPLSIRYLASNPAINHPAAWAWDEGPSGEGIGAAILLVLQVIATLLLLRRNRRLVAEGVPTVGVVTKSYSRRGAGPRVDYQFRTRDGNVATGTGRSDAAVGTPICVLYLPREPRRNRSYPVPGCRVAQ
jgi:hypothetical protein